MKKQLGMQGILFSDQLLNEAIQNNKLLNIQLSIPSRCINDCIYCFQDQKKSGVQLTSEEIFSLIDQMANLNVMYLQILGEGEPLLNKNFLRFVDYANKRGIYINLFTCADVIGDDNLAKKVHGMSGSDIVSRLKNQDISIFVKYELKEEDHITNRNGYSIIRDRALERLSKCGLNSVLPTRLGITPVIMNHNYHELRNIYKWGLTQNIYPHLCVLISTGKTKDIKKRNLDISGEQLISLCIDNIKEAISQGYEYLGPTPFPGGVRCDYIRIGLYIDSYGDAFLCSGCDSGKLGNIKNGSLNDIWVKSYQKRKPFLNGHGCPWKEADQTIPKGYYERVAKQIKTSPFVFSEKRSL